MLLAAGVSPDALRLQTLLRRSSVPYTLLDPRSDSEAEQLIDHLACSVQLARWVHMQAIAPILRGIALHTPTVALHFVQPFVQV